MSVENGLLDEKVRARIQHKASIILDELPEHMDDPHCSSPLGAKQTLNLGLLVHGDEAVVVSRWVSGRIQGGVKEGQQHRGQLLAHLLGIEAGVGPRVGVVTPGELGEGPGSPDGGVVGVEGGVYNQPAVVHQTGIVDALEGIIVHPSGGQVNKNLRGENGGRRWIRSRTLLVTLTEKLKT